MPTELQLSGFQAASVVKFAYFTNDAPVAGTLLYTAFRRNMPPELKEFTVRKPVTFFYGIQQTGGLLNIQVRWINPDGVVARTTDQPMDQSREGAPPPSHVSPPPPPPLPPTPPGPSP